MSYELKAKYDEMMRGIDAMRKGPYTDLAGKQHQRPRDITLRQFIEENYKGLDNQPLSTGHLLADLGIEENRTTAKDLFSSGYGEVALEYVREGIRRGMGLAYREQLAAMRKAIASFAITGEQAGGERFISPEVFLDPVMRGAVQATFYPDLVVREIMVPQPAAVVPKIELSDAATKPRTEGATHRVGTVVFGKKTVEIGEFERGIEITDEAIMFNTLDLLSIFFEDLGRMLGADLNNDAVRVLTDGDQADGSEAAAVIGVQDILEGFQYMDVLRVWTRLALLGRRSTSIIGNEITAVDYLNMPEVKNKQFNGSALLQTNVKTPLPTEQDLYVSTAVAADQLAFEDNSMSMVQLTAKALVIESDRDVKKGLNGSYARIWTGFSNLQRNSRVVIDRTLDFNAVGGANQFPTWMAPYSGR